MKIYNLLKLSFFFLLFSNSSPILAQPKTENFEGETTGAQTFSQGGISFSSTSNLEIGFFANGGANGAGDDRYLESLFGGTLGEIQITTPNRVFRVVDLSVYLSNNGGTSTQDGDITFNGTINGGGTVSHTFNVVHGGSFSYALLSFTGTPLDGVDLTSIEIVLGTGLSYMALDNFQFQDFSATAVTVSIDDVSKLEGNSGNTGYEFTVSRNVNTSAFDVTAQTANGTAASGSDYIAAGPTTISFANGGALTKTFTVSVLGDSSPEDDESFFVNLSGATNGATIADSQGEGTIQDDDTVCESFEGDGPAGSTTFSESGASFTTDDELVIGFFSGGGSGGSSYYLESNIANEPHAVGSVGNVSLTTANKVFQLLSLDLFVSSDGNVNTAEIGTINIVGTKPDATTVTASLTSTMTGGSWSPNLSFASTPLNGVDLVSFEVVTTGSVNYVAIDNLCYSVFDNSTLLVSVGDVTMTEGDAGAQTYNFTVTRNLNTPAFSVTAQTQDVTATAGVDYTAAGPTTINFTNGGALTQTFLVTVVGDVDPEPNESFQVLLSGATNGATISDGTGVGTIIDNDVICEDFESDGGSGSTTFAQGGIGFSVDDELRIDFLGGGGATSSDHYLETNINNVPHTAGSVGKIQITTAGQAFEVLQLDLWTSNDGDATTSEVDDVTFVGTLAGGGTVTATVTSTGTGGSWTESVSFAGTNLENAQLTQLDVQIASPVDYVAIDNFCFATFSTEPEIAIVDADDDAIDDGGGNSPAAGNNTDFGNVCVDGGTQNFVYTIKNEGGTALILDGTPLVSITGAGASHFSVTADPSSPVAPAGSTNFTIEFDPSAAGTHNAQVSIENNDSDEDPYTFDITGVGVASPTTSSAGSNQTICGTMATLAGNSPSVGAGNWTEVTGDGNGAFANANTHNTTFTGTQGVSYTLRWTISNAPCPASSDEVDINFVANPTIAAAGANQSVCGTMATLAGNNPAVGSGMWSEVTGDGNGSFANASMHNTTFTGTQGVNYTLRWTITNAPCTPSSDDVDISLVQNPTSANAGPDQTGVNGVCGTTATLAANAPGTGTGQWSITGVADGNGVIDTPSSPTSNFSGTAGQTYTLTWTISNAPCTSSSDPVDIEFFAVETAEAGPTQTVCGSSTTLAATFPNLGTGTWTEFSGDGNGVFGNSSNPLSTFTGTQGVSYTLRWTVTGSAPCPTTFDDVVINFTLDPTVAAAGSNQSICGTMATLAANNPTIGAGMWSEISGDGNGSFTNANVHNTTFTGTQGVNYTLRWTITNAPCPASSDDVNINLVSNNPTAAAAGSDQTVCTNMVTLAANSPTVGTGSWSIESGDGNGYFGGVPGTLTSNNNNETFTGTQGVSYTLRWTISNTPCPATSTDDVVINLIADPTPANAGADQTGVNGVCGITGTLAANTPSIGTGQWSITGVADGNGVILDPSSPTSTFSGTAGQTYTLTWTISNSPCTSSSDPVDIEFFNEEIAEAGPAQTVCGNSTTLAANSPFLGIGEWSEVSGDGNGVFGNQNSFNSSFNGTPGVNYTLRWTITGGAPCPSTFDDVNINLIDDAVSVSVSPSSVVEDGTGNLVYTFTRGCTENAITVNFDVTTDLSAANDYVQGGATSFGATSGTIGFGVGESTKMVTIDPTVDGIPEVDEQMTLTVTGGTGYTVGTPDSATGTVTDDDVATISIGDVSMNETGGAVNFCFPVTITALPEEDITLTAMTSNGTSVAGGGGIGQSDYIPKTDILTFGLSTALTQQFCVSVLGDNVVELDENFFVDLSNLNANGQDISFAVAQGEGTILNDDQCVITLNGPYSGIEGNSGGSTVAFSVTYSNPVDVFTALDFSEVDGTATLADNDYTTSGSGAGFGIQAGLSGFIFNNSVPILIGDTKMEPDETWTLVVSESDFGGRDIVFSGGGTSANATVIILNDDTDWGDAPDPTYPTLSASGGPSHGGSNLRLGATNDGEADGQPTATANGDMAEDDGVTFTSALIASTMATVEVESSGAGLLDAFIDFNLDGDFIDANEQIFISLPLTTGSNSLSFLVPAGAVQGTSYARFRLSSAGGLASTGPAADGEVEDYQVSIISTQFSIDDPMVDEGDAGTTNLSFTVSRSTNGAAASVNYAITGGTASAGDDYQALAAGTVSFTAGGLLSKTVNVVVDGDMAVELDETVDMTLSNPVNGTIADGTGVGTIKNDDSAMITVGSPSITEGDAGTFSMIFDVNLSNPVDVPVNFNHATSDGTATTADLDFQPTAGMSTIMAGSLMGSVQVLGNGDCQIEADEFFNLTLNTLGAAGRDVTFAGGGASLIGMATIVNDDDLPEVYIPAEFTQGNDAGQCSATVTVPKASTASICGTGVLEFRYRRVLPAPTTAWSAWIPEANNTQVFAVGRHEVEWRITDDSGSNVGNFFFNVVDIESPVISCKAHTAQLDGFGNASIVPTDVYASGSDNCGTVHLVSVTPNTFTCADLGTVMVTLNATDDSGNPGSCMAEVTVADGIAPEAVCQDISIDLDENGMAGIMPADVDGGTGDNCGFALSLDDMDFECADIPSTTVTLTATDASGNSHSCDATVTVNDVTPPNVTCMDAAVELDANGMVSITPATIFAGSSDNCGFIGISGMSETDFDCDDVGENIVTLSVFDGNGNNNSCDATVTVEDNIPAIVACNDLSLSLNSIGQASITPADLFDAVNSTDNCGTFNLVSISQSDFTCVDEGVNTITLSVEDAGGNISTCDATVTIAEFLEIVSVDHTDETCQNAGDGTISIVAMAPAGQLQYSVDNGLSWQATGEFEFLFPGTYNIVVRVNGIPSLCVKTAIEVVGTAPNGNGQTWYKDIDDDGYSDGISQTQCDRPNGFKLVSELIATSGDCNDYDANAVPGQVWYEDQDGDGYGSGNSTISCAQPIGYSVAADLVATSGDCDDMDASVNPSAVEICNGIDDDCDGEIDEGTTGGLTYVGNLLFSNQAQVNAFSNCYSVIDGNLTIQNSGVVDLSSLINLTEVTGNVYIKSTGLASLTGLDNLIMVGGYLRIQSNSSLTTLDGLDAVTSVGSYLRVYRNSNLTDCCAIHDLLANGGVGGSTTISRNDMGCDSVSEIETDCAGGNNFIAPPTTGTGTSQVDFELSMEVMPNPNNGIFTIRLNGFENPGVLRLMDTSGREVWRVDFTEGENSFPVKMQVPVYGIYILHATDGTQSIQEKVLLRKY